MRGRFLRRDVNHPVEFFGVFYEKTDLPARKPVPFGANGSRRDLTAKTPTGSNQASYDAGFPPLP
ncbi:hypothetical protein [Candidatus Arsenophonus triatominarum]|uniref:hypothetical protein n=1 Tax=Candidatus Arsenophonus triatominarum TaxID=57911 RepID=UPI001396CB51|nr:hypothetical protein [Candidatus Arsenophonus triatominarum]